MAHIHLTISCEMTQEDKRRAATELTRLATEYLGRPRELTSVVISTVASGCWFLGGSEVADDRPAYFLDVKVSVGAVIKTEKAWFLDAAASAMSKLLGDVLPESYVVIDEVAADAWGYAGLSHEFRYVTCNTLL